MTRVSDLHRERVRSIKTVLLFIVSVSLLSGETVPTHPSNNLTKINLSVQQFLDQTDREKKTPQKWTTAAFFGQRPPLSGKKET